MSDYSPEDYTYLGLVNRGRPSRGHVSLAYLVSLVESLEHDIMDPEKAGDVLVSLYDIEEQRTPAELTEWQRKFLPKDFWPLTPCMLTPGWSPIGAMLQQGFSPLALRRTNRFRALATGIWEPYSFESSASIEESKTHEELFWAILSQSFEHAKRRQRLISIIAKPGWGYRPGFNPLPNWSCEELSVLGRILWKRSPQG